jgi:hypothetical protein
MRRAARCRIAESKSGISPLLTGLGFFTVRPCCLFDPNAGAEGQIYIGTCTQAGYRNVITYDVDSGEYTSVNIDATYLQADDHNPASVLLKRCRKTSYCLL